MFAFLARLTPIFLVLFALTVVEAGITTSYADARSRSGGRSFGRSAPSSRPPASHQYAPSNQSPNRSGFGSGLAGGLLGGAMGSMLFGSMFGAHGNGGGMGIVPLILLGVAGYFIYKRFIKPGGSGPFQGYQPPTNPSRPFFSGSQPGGMDATAPPPPPPPGAFPGNFSDGLAMIRQTDPGFDQNYFLEIASDVFFKVQAGWMRRDLASYRHLLGDSLATEYEKKFEEMRLRGHINKLESIAIRKVEIVDAGKQETEDFVTVLFTANLLDYTIDEHSGALVEGSMTEPVKFAEEWTWARPEHTENWKLEGIRVVNG